jgi:hypothetical protein
MELAMFGCRGGLNAKVETFQYDFFQHNSDSSIDDLKTRKALGVTILHVQSTDGTHLDW